MPIKIQSDLPVKEILEKENLFVMDENRAMHQDIRPILYSDLKFNATERGNRASASSLPFQYSSAGWRKLYGSGVPSGEKHFQESSEQILSDFFWTER